MSLKIILHYLNTFIFNVCRCLYHGMCKNHCQKFFKLTLIKTLEPPSAQIVWGCEVHLEEEVTLTCKCSRIDYLKDS